LRRFELQRVVADELRRATARLFAEEADEETPSRDACGMAARSRHAFGDRLANMSDHAGRRGGKVKGGHKKRLPHLRGPT